MKKLLTIFLLAATLGAYGQWDTAGLRLQRLEVVPALSATALMATGTIFTYNPAANSVALSLRDKVVSSHNPKLHFDDGKHSFGRLLMLEGGSYLLGAGWLTAFKYGLAVQRPDGSRFNSFPSGHTFTAFTGAEILRREYGEEYPWLAVAGYAVATTVALMRIYNNRHWLGDVCAGAGLGILSVTLVYWTLE